VCGDLHGSGDNCNFSLLLDVFFFILIRKLGIAIHIAVLFMFPEAVSATLLVNSIKNVTLLGDPDALS
jgi:hypothetical protein